MFEVILGCISPRSFLHTQYEYKTGWFETCTYIDTSKRQDGLKRGTYSTSTRHEGLRRALHEGLKRDLHEGLKRALHEGLKRALHEVFETCTAEFLIETCPYS